MDCNVPRKWIAVTGHATNALPDGTTSVGLYVGGAGNVVAKTVDGATDVTIPAVAGAVLYGRFSHVRVSTATGIFALY